MPLYGPEAGKTIIDEALISSFLSLQEFTHIYEGTQFDAKGGEGVAEFDNAGYTHAIRFRATNVTKVTRVELELVKHGNGADLVLEIRDNSFSPDGSNDGDTLRRIYVPKEFLPSTKAFLSIPVDVKNLTQDAYYWLVLPAVGDGTDHFHVHGEITQDGYYPVYRRSGSSGAWSATDAVHFKAFQGTAGDLLHGMYGYNGITWIEYTGELITAVKRYLPPASGPAGGVRSILNYVWDGEVLYKGVEE